MFTHVYKGCFIHIRLIQAVYKAYKAVYNRIVHSNKNLRGKYPKCPSLGDWLDKSWYIHTMEKYISVKNNAATL